MFTGGVSGVEWPGDHWRQRSAMRFARSKKYNYRAANSIITKLAVVCSRKYLGLFLLIIGYSDPGRPAGI
jgi:hypothetical protein